MGFIKWEERFSVGIEQMDQHHQKLFAIINILHSGLSGNHKDFTYEVVIKELMDYTNEHFKAEEALLESVHYPDLMKQKIQHKIFKEKLMQFIDEYYTENKLLSLQMMSFLKDWLINHILTLDKEYEDFVK